MWAEKKNARGLQCWLEKREVGKPSIECIQKLSDHAVDWFLVSPGLTLRGSLDLRRQGGQHKLVQGPTMSPGGQGRVII